MTDHASPTDSPTLHAEENLGWRSILVVAAAYVVLVLIATYPVVLNFASAIPGSLLDPLQHLWIMRWYKACLLEGRSPVLCPEIQYPIGAPLGNFSPLHFQSLLFIPLSLAFRNDVLCFNSIWLFGMVTTGLGTFLLIWHVIRHRGCAAFGGMLAMLSGPMMIHARAHLELIHLGCFPLFLVGWMRFVDAPSRRRLAIAAGLYVLTALCAAYYMVFAIIPAALYVLWGLLRPTRAERRAWLRARIGWFAGFAVAVLPVLVVIFGNHIWAARNGYSMARPVSEFAGFGTKLWTYFTPSALHRANAVMPVANAYASAGYTMETVGERISYLGFVTVFLIHQAAAFRARFPARGFWWACLVLLAILSCGAHWQLGSLKVELPGLWLKENVPAFEMIRVPARFNLFVAVIAALIAAVGLKDLLGRLRTRTGRAAAFSALGALALFDLSTVPFASFGIPERPVCYEVIQERDPGATFLEIPQYSSGGSHLSSLTAYWQSQHRGFTNVGYSGHGNLKFDNLLTWNSPFRAELLANPQYLAGSTLPSMGIVTEGRFEDYAWLYLHVHKFRYVVLHHRPEATPEHALHLDELKRRLAPARIYEDAQTVVYDSERLPAPGRPTLMTTTGWRPGWHEKPMHVFDRTGSFAAYIPDGTDVVQFAFDAKSLRYPMTVRLMFGDRELSRWTVPPDRYVLQLSEPIRLPAGLHELRLECDASIRPSRRGEPALEWDEQPFSLRVGGATLIVPESADDVTIDVPRIASEAEPSPRR